MNNVVRKIELAPGIVEVTIEASRIAKRRKAGQFVIVRVGEGGERIPLTIADADPEAGTITLVVQVVGTTTRWLATLEPGDSILDVAGPLGKPTHIDDFGTVVAVAGGIGVAPLHPIAQAMKAAGNRVIGILGARSKELLVWVDHFSKVSDEVHLVTDDGTSGRKGLVTDVLAEVIVKEKVDLVVAIGPPIMMKAVSEATRPMAIPTVVSLNPVMVDGTGMCGGCRVLIGGKNHFVCVDGPEFDGHLVDFDNMIARLKAYRTMEAESQEGHRFGEGTCRLAK